jgi:hypothetical protein
MKIKPILIIGTAIKIETVLDTANPTSITINIKDPSNIKVVNAVAMTSLDTKIYRYVFQSVYGTHQEGEYQVKISAVYGSYTVMEEAYFTLKDIDNQAN